MQRSHIISLIGVAAVAVVSLTAVLAAGWAPVLGVQLQGGVEVVLRPTEDATDEQLDRAIEIIRNRVDSLGVAEPDITRQGQQVVIQLPGVDDTQRAVDIVGQTAELRFRPVQFTAVAADPLQREAIGQITQALSGAPATTTPPTATTEPPTTEAPTTTEPPATTEAPTTTQAPTTTEFDPATAPSVEDLVTPRERDVAEESVVLPSSDGELLYVLGPAELTGEAVSGAVATFQGQWVVNVDFTGDGADAFDELAVRNFGNQVAIVLDGVVESAPTIQAAEFDGRAVISGAFDERRAENLALVLRFGALPLEFEQDDVRQVSATLGDGTLRAGVVSGIVGLTLVSVWMIFYYRLLGIVAVLSLATSGALLWSLIAWLGESRGLALTLAGATGIIVSVGVQVDSNIVYYERIKEEVGRGRAVRSAADGSFSGAFRTIVWADLASLIGAGVLYTLTSGSVKGFALYLGITVLIDLFVSALFMRPMVMLVARRLVAEKPARIGVPEPSPAEAV